ncbi:MAG: TrmH family RNA methyltransferase [Anaerolineae bacterium]
MEPITSLANPKVRWARSLLQGRSRRREGRFLIEGLRLVEEALRVGSIPTLAFFSPTLGTTPRGQVLLQALQALPEARERILPASEAVLQSLSDTVTPQGIVAAVPFPQPPPGPPGLLLVLDQLRDPGNLGTVLRTAWAAGVEEVWLPPGTVDPYNPKVVRAAMGAHFRIPLRSRVRWDEVAARAPGRPIWLATAQGGTPYDQVDWRVPCILIVGGEAEGASPEAEALATGRVHIRMEQGVESLNAAVAAAVLLFEARRQRVRGRE